MAEESFQQRFLDWLPFTMEMSMFKYAVITDEVSQDLNEVIRFCKDYDLDGMEIRSVWDKPPQELSDTDVDRMKQAVDSAGLKVFGIAAPFLKCDIDNDDQYTEHLEILRKCINLAHRLDTDLIRVFAFWRQDPFEDYIDAIVKKYQEPIRMAESEGIILGLENEHSTMVGTGRDTRILVDRLNSPAVKVIWDPCNEFHDDRGETPYPVGYQHVKDALVHVHIKDALRTGDGAECVPMCEGEIDFKGQFSALAEDGYRGCISLETHWRPKADQIDRELLDRPGGKIFSELGDQASRICFDNTFRLLKEIGISR